MKNPGETFFNPMVLHDAPEDSDQMGAGNEKELPRRQAAQNESAFTQGSNRDGRGCVLSFRCSTIAGK
jgi:hypothetical protein